jgi:uncharacterized protein YndB with AHSA1/START domain
MSASPFVIERTYNASAAQVWEAITDPAKMKQWYFDIPGFKPVVGFEFEFFGGSPDGIQFKHVCRVTEAIAGKKLSHTWTYEGYPGESVVSFELFPEGKKTRLKLTHTGLESFPSDNPNFAKENFIVGWTHILGTSLEEYLVKNV